MNYLLHILVMIGIYGMLALSANLLIGFGGLLMMAQAAFYGQQKLLALARLAALRPALLLLDEPTAALSPAMTEKMVELIKQLVAEQKMTVALIEHNMGVVRKLADVIYFLHEGTVYAHGTQQEVLENPEVRDLYMGNTGGATL